MEWFLSFFAPYSRKFHFTYAGLEPTITGTVPYGDREATLQLGGGSPFFDGPER